MKKITAKKVVVYLEIYQSYLMDNNLDDDSTSISVVDLIDFVDNNIDDEDKRLYSAGGKTKVIFV